MKRYPSWLPKAVIAIVVVPLVAAVVYPIFQKPFSDGPHNACLSNLKQMVLASLIYASDNDDRVEKADGWMDALLPYTNSENVFHDKSGVPDSGYGYAFRGLASRALIADITDPNTFIVIFDSTLTGRNAHSELWSIPQPGRHAKTDNVAFADGHVRACSTGDAENGLEDTLLPALLSDDKSGPIRAEPRSKETVVH